jgi:hypothetical protein
MNPLLIVASALLGQIFALVVLALVFRSRLLSDKVEIRLLDMRHLVPIIAAMLVVSVFTLVDYLLPQFTSALIRTVLPLGFFFFLIMLLLHRKGGNRR